MATIKKALEDFFKAIGGNVSELSDNMDISDVIDDLAGAVKDYVSSESEKIIDDTAASETKTFSSSKINSLIPADELPAVTDADNGKVLTVVSGTWGAAAASSGAEFFTITATETNDGFTLDKTYAEIETAFTAGKILRVNYVDIGGTNWQALPLTKCTFSSDHYCFDFMNLNVGDGVTTIGDLQIDCQHETTLYFYNEIS